MRKTVIILAVLAIGAGLAAGCIPQPTAPGGGEGSSAPGGGIAWKWNDLPGGKQQAAKEGKKIFLYFGGNY